MDQRYLTVGQLTARERISDAGAVGWVWCPYCGNQNALVHYGEGGARMTCGNCTDPGDPVIARDGDEPRPVPPAWMQHSRRCTESSTLGYVERSVAICGSVSDSVEQIMWTTEPRDGTPDDEIARMLALRAAALDAVRLHGAEEQRRRRLGIDGHRLGERIPGDVRG